MIWSVRQTRRFARQYKKLHDNTAADVDSAVEMVRKALKSESERKGILQHCTSTSFEAQVSYICLAIRLMIVFVWCTLKRWGHTKTSIGI